MGLTVTFASGQGTYNITDFPTEQIRDAHPIDQYQIVDANITAKGIQIIPAAGWVLDHCTYGVTITTTDSEGQQSTVTIPQTDTGTGANQMVCTWSFADVTEYLNGRAVNGTRSGYNKFVCNAGYSGCYGIFYDWWRDSRVYPTTGYPKNSTMEAELKIYLRAIPQQGIIYSPTRNNAIIYDVTTGLPLCYA